MKNEKPLLPSRSDGTVSALRDALGTLRRPPVILCIGSDRVTGDCIGPLVGHLLASRELSCSVLGTLTEPVTALNLDETVSLIKRRYAGRKVVAIDSCVGESDELGKIRVSRGAIRPGLACGKSLPKVGDVSITATVASGSSDNLYSVRLGFVYSLASEIADSLACALQQTANKSERKRAHAD
ncbi:MAG: spore protease YyaC [Clostridia bacterium]|nr:spore protease YyaC [Clostridia bacterium]